MEVVKSNTPVEAALIILLAICVTTITETHFAIAWRKLHLKTGSLTIVGTGIQLVGHLTLAAKASIEQADKVLFAVADPVTAKWLQTLNVTAEALPYNTNNQWRRETYREMVDRILAEVRQGLNICAVFYGHPGVFAYPTHEAIKQARREGFRAQMLPGISAEDCLFADLGLDPGRNGCQSFEATDFLIRGRKFDPTSALILWQIATIGNLGFYQEEIQLRGLNVLAEVLETYYGADHEVIVYEAAVYYPVCEPVIQHIPLSKLAEIRVTLVSTLYVPPQAPAPVDSEMMARLGMSFVKET
ncbi:SAM-dependent methyltransferase [Microcoleus sp. LAD1_D5]|uniref:SAM-dependent methyltransferase n=1 Tax=unclassified Microcoleus TaxID=2642155 RepID=UPI002FD06152